MTELWTNQFFASMKKRTLTPAEERLLREGGYATGSRFFGVETPDSDWDILIFKDNLPPTIPMSILAYNAEEKYIHMGMKFISAKFKREGTDRVVNLIVPFTTAELNRWTFATSMMATLPKELIKDKAKRVAIFEAFKAIEHRV